ncbi:MAG: pyrroline-5-carboxylate reductase [Candidatus Omnitrophica bacterium]|nr:pyrroline-5-carboxylate reductase [Candidatus Omnitrophota bacterium]MCF7894042.1 pyrroline-5-carboxylate reductase [Candidatus Omnitrophota bacterium]
MIKKEKTIGIVGFGNMGSACAQAIALSDSYKVLVYDKRKSIKYCYPKVTKAKNLPTLIKESQLLILAIKPRDLDLFLEKNAAIILATKPLLISILAGVKIKTIEKKLPKIKVVRAMPNLAVKVKEAVTFITAGKLAKQKDLKEIKNIFSLMGYVLEGKEHTVDKITALSGSGPGFVYYFMKSFYKTALKMGFKKKEAKKIIVQTFQGASKLAFESDKDFSELLDLVASPGGTTEAGVSSFDKLKLSQKISKGLYAAYKKAKKISLGSTRRKG